MPLWGASRGFIPTDTLATAIRHQDVEALFPLWEASLDPARRREVLDKCPSLLVDLTNWLAQSRTLQGTECHSLVGCLSSLLEDEEVLANRNAAEVPSQLVLRGVWFKHDRAAAMSAKLLRRLIEGTDKDVVKRATNLAPLASKLLKRLGKPSAEWLPEASADLGACFTAVIATSEPAAADAARDGALPLVVERLVDAASANADDMHAKDETASLIKCTRLLLGVYLRVPRTGPGLTDELTNSLLHVVGQRLRDRSDPAARGEAAGALFAIGLRKASARFACQTAIDCMAYLADALALSAKEAGGGKKGKKGGSKGAGGGDPSARAATRHLAGCVLIALLCDPPGSIAALADQFADEKDAAGPANASVLARPTVSAVMLPALVTHLSSSDALTRDHASACLWQLGRWQRSLEAMQAARSPEYLSTPLPKELYEPQLASAMPLPPKTPMAARAPGTMQHTPLADDGGVQFMTLERLWTPVSTSTREYVRQHFKNLSELGKAGVPKPPVMW
ncbi:hypothetical protein NFJ02_38g96990 [Pycnococcus provasolii]